MQRLSLLIGRTAHHDPDDASSLLFIGYVDSLATHRFERLRGLVTIHSKKLWQSKRRELPLDRIADVVLQEKQVKGGEAGLRYWVEYVTTQGERIVWSDFTSSKDDKLECIQALREFLKNAVGPYPRGGAPTIE